MNNQRHQIFQRPTGLWQPPAPLAPDRRGLPAAGFTLMELIIVMVIVAILASQVVMGLTSATGKVKSAVFALKGDINLARGEAVSRNTSVRFTFLFDTDLDGDGVAEDGYRIWVDDWDAGAGAAGSDATYTADDPATGGVDGDSLIRQVALDDEVQFYDTDLSSKGGPTESAGGTLSWSPNDGVELGLCANEFNLSTIGEFTCSGSIYLYVPKDTPPTDMKAKPFAVTIATSGSVRISRWRPEDNAWSTK